MKFISQITVDGETREISPNQIPFQVKSSYKGYVTLFKESHYTNSKTYEIEYGLLPNFAPMYLDNKDIRGGYFNSIEVMQDTGTYPLMGIALASYFDSKSGVYTSMGLLPYLKTYTNNIRTRESHQNLGNLCFSASGSIGVPYGSGMILDDGGNLNVNIPLLTRGFSNVYSCPVVHPGYLSGDFSRYLNVPMNKYLFGFGDNGVYLRINTTPIPISDNLEIGLDSNDFGLCLKVIKK